ncbi:DUF202 domain-containing protein [Lentzea sp. NPDC051208]|uniref:YidH family protein n=1 Tax=Lentzea sp. NPDC051208 TaxID=3154642 RepID=UPI00342FBD85
MTAPRFPRRVYDHGEEPDPRFTLANERNFLAWMRTSLALLAGGVALEALTPPIHPVLRLTASTLLLVLALAVPASAWWGWSTTERALRQGQALPASGATTLLAIGVGIVATVLLLGITLR